MIMSFGKRLSQLGIDYPSFRSLATSYMFPALNLINNFGRATLYIITKIRNFEKKAD